MHGYHGRWWTFCCGCISKYAYFVLKIFFYECVCVYNHYIGLLLHIIVDGEPIVHKTFHSYTVRAKQGFAQSSRTNGNHAKSAGASLRRYNEASLIQVYFQEYLYIEITNKLRIYAIKLLYLGTRVINDITIIIS